MVTRAENAIHSPNAKVRWLGPLPIWTYPSPVGLRLQDNGRAVQPAILRFDHDDFIPEFIGLLNSEPQRLGEWLARPETWRAPMATPTLSHSEVEFSSKVAFLYDKTRRLTAAKKLQLPTAINLNQPLKTTLNNIVSPVPAISDEQMPLKLFQASQKRHYLVSASLIREDAGLPDCEPELSRQEKASFVLRRLLPPDDNANAPLDQWDEYAFVPGARSNNWRRIGRYESAAARTLISREEQLPMFPVSFHHKACGQSRRLLSGSIPVCRREQWVGAAIGGDAASDVGNLPASSRSMAAMLFQTDVIAPWKLLLEQAEFKKNAAAKNFSNFSSDAAAQAKDKNRLMRTSRDELQTGSWYVMLDFAKFLQSNLPDIWQVLKGDKPLNTLEPAEQAVVNALTKAWLSAQLAWRILSGKSEKDITTDADRYLYQVLQYFTGLQQSGTIGAAPYGTLLTLYQLGYGVNIPSATSRYKFTDLKWSLADALVAVAELEQGLEQVDTTFIRFEQNFDANGKVLNIDTNWPGFLFPLADPDSEVDAPIPAVAAAKLAGLTGLERKQSAVDVLAEMIEALLPAGEPAEQLMDSLPLGDPRDVWFVIRCVYERPNCGPLFKTLVSAPTQRFQMAAFFDPEAPARPVRIPMPLDISPAGLRKYQKNTGFVISDMLCGKIKGIRKMTFADLVLSVLPWPFHKDLPEPASGTCKDGSSNGFGMICSLSIPIVTLCALILMMIMVALFDLFFRWIPYLFLCLPIPGLKGKESS